MPSVKKPSAALLERVQADKPVATNNDLKQIAMMVQTVHDIDVQLDKLGAEVDKLHKRRNAIVMGDLPALFDAAGVDNVTLAGGTKVKVDTQYYPNILVQNKPKLFAWLRKIGAGAMVKTDFSIKFGKGEEAQAKKFETLLGKSRVPFTRKEDVNTNTLKAFIREAMEKKVKLPAFVDPNPVRTTIIKEGEK